MDVSSISAYSSTPNVTSTSSTGDLGKQDFMRLLLAQLRNQDPLNPMEDREFITQMAQLNTLEQLQALNERIGELIGSDLIGRATELIGREVEAVDEYGYLVRGVVEGVRFGNGMPWLQIGGVEVLYDNVTAIYGTSEQAPEGGAQS